MKCKDQEEVDFFWNKFTDDGGQESRCGWLKDKFGLSWQIIPDALGKLMNDKDPAKAQRVMQAMLKMNKIEVKLLQDAYEGKYSSINSVNHTKVANKIKAKSVAKSKKKVTAKSKAAVTKDRVTANQFIATLNNYQSDAEREKIQRYFKSDSQYNEEDRFMGVRMGTVFTVAKEFMNMELAEVEKLLESPIHEIRTGAVSIMDFQARNRKTTPARKKELFDLYIERHDRINNWDLVDRSAPYVVGGYLFDQPRTVLYKLAKSKNVWERRTAIVSTYFFIRQGDVDDTFKIAALLLKDKHDLIHKAAGGWIREAGKRDRRQLFKFLDEHAAIMPRTMLRYVIEHLDKKEREHYLNVI